MEGQIDGQVAQKTSMIDTTGSLPHSGAVEDNSSLHFSKLKIDEKFLKHLEGIKENLAAPVA